MPQSRFDLNERTLARTHAPTHTHTQKVNRSRNRFETQLKVFTGCFTLSLSLAPFSSLAQKRKCCKLTKRLHRYTGTFFVGNATISLAYCHYNIFLFFYSVIIVIIFLFEIHRFPFAMITIINVWAWSKMGSFLVLPFLRIALSKQKKEKKRGEMAVYSWKYISFCRLCCLFVTHCKVWVCVCVCVFHIAALQRHMCLCAVPILSPWFDCLSHWRPNDKSLRQHTRFVCR